MRAKAKDRQRRREADRHWKERTRCKAAARDGRRLSQAQRRGSGVPAERRPAVAGATRRRRRARQARGSLAGTKTKVRNRCVDTGYGRSVRRWFRKSGRQVREQGRRGRLEGVYRVSW